MKIFILGFDYAYRWIAVNFIGIKKYLVFFSELFGDCTTVVQRKGKVSADNREKNQREIKTDINLKILKSLLLLQ